MAQSNASEHQAVIGCLTQKACSVWGKDRSASQQQSVTVESVAESKETIWQDKLHICTPGSPVQKSSKILARGLTTKGKGLEPYWNDLCEEISSRLLLPQETDLPDSGLNCLNTWSVSTVEKSWLSVILKAAQNQNLPPIFSQSFTSEVVEFMDSENTVRKSKKIRIYLKAEQRALIDKWLGGSRYLFNKTVEILKDGTVKANWKAIKTERKQNLPDWCKAIPYQIKSIAIKDACAAINAAKKKYKKTGQINRVKFRSRKNPIQSCYIPKSAVSDKGIYLTKLGKLTFSEPRPQKICDCRLVRNNGNYYLVVPYQATIQKTENQGRVVALDPGVRTFLTFFSEKSVGKIGLGDFSKIQRLCHHLDRLFGKISKAKGGQKRRMKKAARRITIKIQNLINELHHKSAKFLVDNFDVILLPTFETSEMSKRGHRKIQSKTVRNMLSFAHYRFKQFLKHKANSTGKLVLDVCEAYTSKTVSWTGELVNIGGHKIIFSKVDGQKMDRDINGARGIFWRALVDTPWMRNHLALVS